MKRIAVLIVVICLVFTTGMSFASGQTFLGAGYFNYSSKWQPEKIDWKDAEIEQNQVYVQIGRIKPKDWEGYLRLGGADVRIKDAFDFDAPRDFENGYKPYLALGYRKSLYNIYSWEVGPFFQFCRYSDYRQAKNVTIMGMPGWAELEYKNPWSLDLGLALQTNLDKAVVCFGPFLYWAKAEAKAEVEAFGMRMTDSTDYEEKGVLGGFIRARFLFLYLEAQYKSRGSVGFSINFFI